MLNRENKEQIVDHLFRHQYGKMVAVMIRIFGSEHLETIEDAVQDTFAKALAMWRKEIPPNPEGWLMTAAKNRVIDLFRKINAEHKRLPNLNNGLAVIALREVFLDHEIEDAQLRMIFMACHPTLHLRDQIAFALKTISGFSRKEIASALLLKEETVKKRLTRARKTIKSNQIEFQIPQGKELPSRMESVLEVLYLLFNEGFHSGSKEILVRKDLCGEAIRLNKMLLKNKFTDTAAANALFGLMCFQAARLDSKLNEANEIIDLQQQDRRKWFRPLIFAGHDAMVKATKENTLSTYHYEAAIAAEHLKAKTFQQTNWKKILQYYQQLYELQPSDLYLMNLAYVYVRLNNATEASTILKKIQPATLEQRSYLYYGTVAELHLLKKEIQKALESLDKAIALVKNEAEKKYLIKKKEGIVKK